MKRLLVILIIVSLLTTGFTTVNKTYAMSESKTNQVAEKKNSDSGDGEGGYEPVYRTLLSREGKLDIVRKPLAPDFSLYYPTLTELPQFDPESDNSFQVDLRSQNISHLDVSNRLYDLTHSIFDSKTIWPEKLPAGFDPGDIMELGKNPGLNIRQLHKDGITGKGVGVAIIDQGLLVEHKEYKSKLKLYEEIHCVDEYAAMHGPAVASIAVGENCGVAPGADLYYIAETHGVFTENEFKWDLSWLAKSIDRIVEVNKTLKKDKIRVISISLGIGPWFNGYEEVYKSIEKAEKDGIYVVYVQSEPFLGLGRDASADPDDVNLYTLGRFLSKYPYNNNQLLVPMDSRCTASPTGPKDYVFYKDGGLSWTVPYVAGLYALACEVKPEITPEVFWEKAMATADSNKDGLGKIVNPAKLIESLKD